MMKLKWIGSLLILAGVVGCKTPDRPNLVEYVNPNIGTVHSRWFFYTPAASLLEWLNWELLPMELTVIIKDGKLLVMKIIILRLMAFLAYMSFR